MHTKTTKIFRGFLLFIGLAFPFEIFVNPAQAAYVATARPYILTEHFGLSAFDTPLQFQEDQRQFKRDMDREIQKLQRRITELRQLALVNLSTSKPLNLDQVQILEENLRDFANDVQRSIKSANINTWEDTKQNLLVSLSEIRTAIESARH